jgi:hypothetical protein
VPRPRAATRRARCGEARAAVHANGAATYAAIVVAPGVREPPSLPERARDAGVRVLPLDRFDAPSILAGLVMAYKPAAASPACAL